MEDFGLQTERVVECIDPGKGFDGAGKPVAQPGSEAQLAAKKKLDDQILRAQRLESIGMLASGIAHDLNNVLAPIILAAPVLREHVTNPDDLRIITSLEKSAERGVDLVRQILAFAQGVGGGHQRLEVRHILQETASVIGETFPKNIRLEHDIPEQPLAHHGRPDPDPPGDPQPLRQRPGRDDLGGHADPSGRELPA